MANNQPSEKSFTPEGFGSQAIHAGHETDPLYAHLTPIYATSTFVYDDAEQGMRRFSGKEPGYIYSRFGNPSTAEAERKISALESHGLKDASGNQLQLAAILHASGMGAVNTLLMTNLKGGDKILSHYSLYAGTQDNFQDILPGLGISAILEDLHDPIKAEAAIRANPTIRLLYLETPANPSLRCVDLEMLTSLAKKYGLIVACDNTFATPFLQQPFRYGADFVIHSTTKFLNGHGTSIGGVLVGRDLSLMNGRARKIHKTLGANSNPFDAFLLVNGIKTLELRMERHCSNALAVAKFLENHPAVARVHYNGLPSHPDYAISLRQMRHPGAMMSFELRDGLEAGVRCMNRLQMCTRTVSLGTCDTLLCHPASMTHSSLSKEQREQNGISDGLIRMSVGLENIVDIIADLGNALTSYT